MEKLILIFLFLGVQNFIFGQIESKKTPLKIAPITPKIPPTTAVKPKANPFQFDTKPKYNDMFPDPLKSKTAESGFGKAPITFTNPHKDMVNKLNQKEGYQGDGDKVDRNLGEFKTTAKWARLVCRDFGEVDGDLVRVYNNDKIVEYEIYLTSSFQEVTINLEPGFNKIEFQALNMGTSGPNTAEFKMYDDKGKLITANQWNLMTGVKANIIIVKE